MELASFDSKQHLGLHVPRVWSERSVERAHPMAWLIGSLTILWHRLEGREGSQVVRERPRYKKKVTPTFTDMLGALRLQTWEHEAYGGLRGSALASMHQDTNPQAIGRRLRSESLA